LTERVAKRRTNGRSKAPRTQSRSRDKASRPPVLEKGREAPTEDDEDEDAVVERATEDSGDRAAAAAVAEQSYITALQAKPWRDRQAAIELMIEELQTKPEPGVVRAIAERLLALTSDSKWEVRLAICRGLVHLTHPLFETIASTLEEDHNNYVSKAARQAADRRRELDREYQRKTDEIDVVHGELEGLRREHGERVAAAAERLAEHKYKLLTNETTHEMRTVVAGLLDALGKLQGNLETSRTAKKHWERNLSIALDRTKFLKRMLDDTKKLVDDPKPELEDADLAEMLHKVVGLVRDALHVPAEVRFEIDLGTRPGTHLHVPRVRLIQALSSLAKNAIEAVEGKGRVVLRTSHNARRGWIEIAIIDSGYGMDREEIRRALLPMVSTKKDDQHTGVGLPLARKIIERECRGEFVIESEPDKGTTVRCLLPEAVEIERD
jgi:signal transduction histidine kinase